ncbi:unannotated protein [freshwater metagenome]|uniref:Unannotated protein n=1 Tax=freshwater metagenome TaxID=449393 RepID=A0A6J7B0N9_9ZZZZ
MIAPNLKIAIKTTMAPAMTPRAGIAEIPN